MEDDHVDRPGVDVQQCMKLTGTNRPIGLIVLVACAHQAKLDDTQLLLSWRASRAADGPRQAVFCLKAKTGARRPLACMGA